MKTDPVVQLSRDYLLHRAACIVYIGDEFVIMDFLRRASEGLTSSLSVTAPRRGSIPLLSSIAFIRSDVGSLDHT